MTERSRQLTVAALQRAITDSTRPEKIRRACALRLSRLRAAITAPTKRTATTTRTKLPAPVPTEKACHEAYQSFIALAQQRTALFNKRRSAAEQDILGAMIALMPSASPQGSDATEWRNFIAQIDGLLAEIKAIKTL